MPAVTAAVGEALVADDATGEAPPRDPQGGRGASRFGEEVITHARRVVFQMAEVAVPKRLFRAMLERIRRLRMLETVSG